MKKKYLILLLPLIFTGCFGKAGSGILTAECKRNVQTASIEEVDRYIFEYVNGNITKIKITKSYNQDVDLEASMKAYNTFNGVNASISGMEITYDFDLDIVSDEVKDIFDIKDTYNEQIKTLKNLDYICND